MNCKIPNRQSKTRTEHCRNLQFFSFPLMLIDERGCENSVCVPLILPNVRPHNLSYQHWLISFLFMSLLLVFSHFLFFEKKKKKKTISLLFNQNRKQNNYPLSSSDLLFAWNFYTFFCFQLIEVKFLNWKFSFGKYLNYNYTKVPNKLTSC